MFEQFTYDAIMERMLDRVSDTLDKREGSVIFDAIAPAALELSELYIMLDLMMNELFADSASYYYLAKRAAERGIFPREESRAVCKMVVSPLDVTIAAGERFNLNDLNYSVIAPVEDETGSFQVVCETAGTVGNQQVGTLLPIEYVPGLESAKITEVLIPGEDEEDVEALRSRYFASFEDTEFGGNRADYIAKVTGIEGVGSCKVIRKWENGYRPVNFLPDEIVREWFANQSPATLGVDVYEWVQSIYEASVGKYLTVGGTVEIIILSSEYKVPSSVLVDYVQSILDPEDEVGEGGGMAPIGHVVNVSGATEILLDYDLELVYEHNISFADVEEAICQSIDAYHNELRMVWAESDRLVVRVGRIESLLLNIPGIVDVTRIMINGVSANFNLESEQVPARGAVNG